MKTPADTLKGLRCCKVSATHGYCQHCPYEPEEECEVELNRDALARIEQLEYALCLMISQYCREGDHVTHRHMMAGEHAFAALGIEDYSSIETVEEMLDGMEGPT